MPPVQRAAARGLAALVVSLPGRLDTVVSTLLETLTLRLTDALSAAAEGAKLAASYAPHSASVATLAMDLLHLRPRWPVPILAQAALAKLAPGASMPTATDPGPGARPSSAAPTPPEIAPKDDGGHTGTENGGAEPVVAAPLTAAGWVVQPFVTVGARDDWPNSLELQGLLGALRAVLDAAASRVWASLDLERPGPGGAAVAASRNSAPPPTWSDRFLALAWALVAIAHAGSPNLVAASVELHGLLWTARPALERVWNTGRAAMPRAGAADSTHFPTQKSAALEPTMQLWDRLEGILLVRCTQLLLARSAHGFVKPFVALQGLCLESLATAFLEHTERAYAPVVVPAAAALGAVFAAPVLSSRSIGPTRIPWCVVTLPPYWARSSWACWWPRRAQAASQPRRVKAIPRCQRGGGLLQTSGPRPTTAMSVPTTGHS